MSLSLITLLSDFNQLLPPPFSYIIAGAFGAIIGSFLNVVIHRLPLEESVAFPSSKCPSCSTEIAFYDNVPVLSYVLLGGVAGLVRLIFRLAIPRLSYLPRCSLSP